MAENIIMDSIKLWRKKELSMKNYDTQSSYSSKCWLKNANNFHNVHNVSRAYLKLNIETQRTLKTLQILDFSCIINFMCCIVNEICFAFKTERAVVPLDVSLLDTDFTQSVKLDGIPSISRCQRRKRRETAGEHWY